MIGAACSLEDACRQAQVLFANWFQVIFIVYSNCNILEILILPIMFIQFIFVYFLYRI